MLSFGPELGQAHSEEENNADNCEGVLTAPGSEHEATVAKANRRRRLSVLSKQQWKTKSREWQKQAQVRYLRTCCVDRDGVLRWSRARVLSQEARPRP